MSSIGWAEECPQHFHAAWEATRNTIGSDYGKFYAPRQAGLLAAGLGIAAVLAHSEADPEIQRWYQQSVRDHTTNEIARFVKPLGNGRIMIPCYAGMAMLGRMTNYTQLGTLSEEWGIRSLRTLLVGVLPLLVLQNATGASRPTEGDSHWHPFAEDHGVSGHSFMGAVPFLSAAMMTENLSLKTLFYTGSTLCGLSRINDDKHYLSQVMLGWWLAYLSAKSVDKTEAQVDRMKIMPIAYGYGIGMTVEIRF
jgi:hypothetical protein